MKKKKPSQYNKFKQVKEVAKQETSGNYAKANRSGVEARPFQEDGSEGWGHSFRDHGSYGSHAVYDDYGEDSLA